MLNEGKDFALNSKGYLINFEAWDKDFASNIAQEHGLELTDCHWKIIHFLRDYYLEFGVSPDPREIIKKLGKTIDHDEPCTKKRLEGLFANGGCKLACQISGLPDCHCRGL